MKNNFIKYRKYLLIILYLPVLAQAFIYQQLDENGKISFSDTPNTSTTLVQLKSINSYSSTSTGDNQSSTSLNNKITKVVNNYKKMTIMRPTPQQTFQNQHEMTALVQIEPALQAKDKLEWWLDGKSYQQSTELQIVLKSLGRGEHTLQVKLLDANNQALMITAIVNFYVHYAIEI